MLPHGGAAQPPTHCILSPTAVAMVAITDYSIGRLRLDRRRLRSELLVRLHDGEDVVELAPVVLRFLRVRRDLARCVARTRAVRCSSFNINSFSTEQALSLFRFKSADLSRVATTHRRHPVENGGGTLPRAPRTPTRARGRATTRRRHRFGEGGSTPPSPRAPRKTARARARATTRSQHRVGNGGCDGRTPGPHTRGTSPSQSTGDTWIRVRSDRIQSVRNGHWLSRGKYVLLTHISNHLGGDPLVIAP